MSRYVQLRWASAQAKSAGEQPVSHLPLMDSQVTSGQAENAGPDTASGVVQSDECPCVRCAHRSADMLPQPITEIRAADSGSDSSLDTV